MEINEALYAKWLAGEISDHDLVAEEGAEALEELRKVVNTVDLWSMPKYDTTEGFQALKQTHIKPKSKVVNLRWLKTTSAIAAGIAALVICWFAFSNQDEVLRADQGQNFYFAFSDESETWLNDGSSIEYNSKDWSNQRSIDLTGEALFQVKKGKPFVVNTKLGSISVLGTKFNVRAWGENLYVECYEGKVLVEANNQSTILTANQSVKVTNAAMEENQVITDVTPIWQNGASRFYEEKLTTVFAELGRQYDIKVSISEPDRLFSGNFRHDDLETALTSICKPLGLTYVMSADSKTVVIE